jgi:acetamidase/formamidase
LARTPWGQELDEAVNQADRRAQLLSPQDAYTLCSITADLRMTQTVDGNKGAWCKGMTESERDTSRSPRFEV